MPPVCLAGMLTSSPARRAWPESVRRLGRIPDDASRIPRAGEDSRLAVVSLCADCGAARAETQETDPPRPRARRVVLARCAGDWAPPPAHRGGCGEHVEALSPGAHQ